MGNYMDPVRKKNEEYDCLALVASGHTAAEAGRIMNMSEGTIKRRLESLRKRLGAKDTIHALFICEAEFGTLNWLRIRLSKLKKKI